MRRTGKAYGTLAAATTLAMLSGGLAFADQVSNTIDTTVDAATETLNVAVGDSAPTTIYVKNQNLNDGDTNKSCNLAGDNTSVTLSVSSSDTEVATVSPSSITIEDCGTESGHAVTVRGVANGPANVTFAITSYTGTGTMVLDTAAFLANVGTGIKASGDPCASVHNPAAPVFSAPAAPATTWFTTAPTAAATSTTQGATLSYAVNGATTFSGTVPSLGQGVTTVAAKATDATCSTKTSATSREFKVDSVAPSVSPESPAPDTTWRNTDLSQAFTASDAAPGSGLANSADASFTLTASANSTKNDDGTFTATEDSKTVADVAGNTTSRSVSALIDKTAPIAGFGADSPVDGATYWSTRVPTATCTFDDALSGPAATDSCVVTQNVVGGSHTVTATAKDKAGNTHAVSRTYTVRDLTHTGFYSPVDMGANVLNTVKGGSTVPLKFNLQIDGAQQDATALVTGFTANKVTCATGAVEDAVDFVTTGSTALRWDATGAQFIQNWKTPTGAGTCYKATATLADGDTISALFKLK